MNKFTLEVPSIGYKKDIILTVEYSRFLFYGGALKSADNSAFHFASLNVMKDYNNDGKIIRQSVDSAKKIIDKINSQDENSIQSIDFFCHGDMFGLYLIKGSSIYVDISKEDRDKKNLNASLYIGKGTRFWKGYDLHEESGVLSDIDFSKFTSSCKIEIHGCLTAGSAVFQDNLCKDFSEYLYDNGKKNAVVIGHTEKANPNIKNKEIKDKKTGKIIKIKTSNEEQDYRQGERKVFNNGNVILVTRKKGRITGKEINNALPKN